MMMDIDQSPPRNRSNQSASSQIPTGQSASRNHRKPPSPRKQQPRSFFSNFPFFSEYFCFLVFFYLRYVCFFIFYFIFLRFQPALWMMIGCRMSPRSATEVDDSDCLIIDITLLARITKKDIASNLNAFRSCNCS